MDESTVPRWQRVWVQLPREVRGQLARSCGLVVSRDKRAYRQA